MASSLKLMTFLSELESHIPKRETTNPLVSEASIGWHIDHSLKVINNVFLALQSSDPKTLENNMSFLGKFLLLLGKFPRGKAKAPKHVLPPELITKDELIAQLRATKKNIETIATLPNKAYFNHPIFGHINKTRSIRFLEVHTKHHLKIIKDILK